MNDDIEELESSTHNSDFGSTQSNFENSLQLTHGMRFPSAILALYPIQFYALYLRKSVKAEPRSGIDSIFICTSGRSGGSCPFLVQLFKRKCGIWIITNLCEDHMDCVSVAKATFRQIPQLPTNCKELKRSQELIQPYLETFSRLNPGSTALMEKDDLRTFKSICTCTSSG
ncbi:hypothetical protein PHMEG_00026417 [Phytophthora megakarya]|uniref:Uncharacterized protein n=1 Tax=Phytophthora megakarya TaxID=4795 RepID=A0A225V9N5_9STRA|nr:hypothetical protein PHMEG_00026417 [Phytophthora megakarya]